MANFGQLILTTLGIRAYHNALASGKMKFKRIGMGSGKYTGNVWTLTKLVNEEVSVAVSKGYVQNDAFTIEGFFSNEGLQTGFAWREIGVFVEDETGNEVLYAYANAGDSYDYIPATADERYSKYIRVATAIGNATNVSIVENEGILYVDTVTFNTLRDEVATLHPTKEASGEILVVEDSANIPLAGLSVYGKSTQVVTNGYQLFDASKVKTTSAYGATVTNNGDGSFTVGGRGNLTANFAAEHTISHDEMKRLFKAGTVYLNTEMVTMPFFFVNLYKGTSFVSTVLLNKNVATASFQMLQSYLDDDSYTMRFGFSGASGNTIKAGAITPMLYQDGDGEWEPFTGGAPAPSPEYPQDIASAGDSGRIELRTYGRNIVNASSLAGVTTGTNKSVTVSEDGYNIVAVGGSDVAYASTGINLPVTLLKGKTVILQADAISNTVGTGGTAQLNITTPSQKLYLGINASDLEKSVEIPADTTGILLTVYSNNKGDLLESDNTATFTGLMLSFSGGKWEPYRDYQNAIFDTPNGLPGIPVTSGGNYIDSDGQRWVCDEIDFSRGVYIQRIARKTYNGDEGWTKASSSADNWGYYIAVTDGVRGNLLCDKLHDGDTSKAYINMSTTGGGKTAIVVSLYGYMESNTLTAFRAAMAEYPLTVMYVLASPVEKALTAAQVEAYKALTTNNPCTTILTDSGAGLKAEVIGRSFEAFFRTATADHPLESPDYPGCRYYIVDGEVEWVNPPMKFNTEYRTTERYMGAPVYTKLIRMNFNVSNTGVKVQTLESVIEGAIRLWVESMRQSYDSDGLMLYGYDHNGSPVTYELYASVDSTRISITCDLSESLYESVTVYTHLKYTRG